MQQPTYQTVKLSRGKHTSPEIGACVMELASMLAGERFSDHPQSVSRPIAAFLRGYNDMLDDRRRQGLYEYAAKVVGTAAPLAVEKARAKRLVEWANERREARPVWRLLARLKLRREADYRDMNWASATRYAIRTIGKVSDETHAAALSLVDELIALGGEGDWPAAPWDTAAIGPDAAMSEVWASAVHPFLR